MNKGLLLFLSIIVLNPNIWATSSVLIANEAITPAEFTKFINSKKGLISFIDIVEANSGSVSRELIQTVGDLDSAPESLTRIQIEEELIKELTSGPLTPIRKNLLLKVLQTSSREPLNRELQMRTIFESPIVSHGSVTSTLKLLRDDDQLYINGFKINPNELANLKLYPKVRYHIAYLSNVTYPHYQWVLGEDIKPPRQINLATGTCLKPHVDNLKYVENPLVLFQQNCIGRASSNTEDIQLGAQKFAPNLSAVESQAKKNQAWAIGGSLLLFGTLIYEAQREYDISVNLPF